MTDPVRQRFLDFLRASAAQRWTGRPVPVLEGRDGSSAETGGGGGGPADPLQALSPQLLAYVGDALYDLYVRTALVMGRGGGLPVEAIHRETVDRVRAEAQADRLREIEAILTPEEQSIVRRGRNTKGQAPRRANVVTYRYSTGFEALLGYLYLSGRAERLAEILELALRSTATSPQTEEAPR